MVQLPWHERKRREKETLLAYCVVNRKRFDTDLYANVPEQRQLMLDYMATEEQGSFPICLFRHARTTHRFAAV